MINLDLIGRPINPPPTCKGLFFRYRKSDFFRTNEGNQLMRRESYKVLKKKSCTGCSQCGMFWDDYQEGGVVFPKNPKDFDVYQAIFIPGMTDWETGYLDEWKWELRKKVDEKLPR